MLSNPAQFNSFWIYYGIISETDIYEGVKYDYEQSNDKNLQSIRIILVNFHILALSASET